jgi:hypothetical protein
LLWLLAGAGDKERQQQPQIPFGDDNQKNRQQQRLEQRQRQKQIPFGDDNQKNRQQQQLEQRQRQKQIPFGDDNQKKRQQQPEGRATATARVGARLLKGTGSRDDF